MKRIILTGCFALLLAGVASSPARAQVDVPPTYLAPDDGATLPTGSAPTFRIQTFAGDQYLWLFISRSPAVVNPCGTIGGEVWLEPFRATANPAVYEAKPPFFDLPGSWLNTPGTYYWQAHRIGGADGCVEGPVRSLTLRIPTPAGPTRAEYIALADPICGAARRAFNRLDKASFRAFRRLEFGRAARLFGRGTSVFSRMINDLAALDPPEANASLIDSWLRSLRSQVPLARKLAKAIRRVQLGAIGRFARKLDRASARTQKKVKGFGFKSCSRV